MTQRRCTCSMIRKYAEDPSMPISFNERFSEYHLPDPRDPGGYIVLTYCFHCGGALPPSKRGDLFHDVDDTEMQKFIDKLEGATTIDDVVDRLGEPDCTIQPPPTETEDLYGVKRVNRQLDYTRLSPTVVLTVSEYSDGSIEYGCSGKPRRDTLGA